jgi:hypothetical protein
MNALKLTAAATIALAALGAASAQAESITVRDFGSIGIHPYFKSSCFTSGIKDWQYFGFIGAHSQFTWGGWEQGMDPKCKHPVVKFTYTQDGDPPLTKPIKSRVVKIESDPTVDYAITLGDSIVVTDVQPPQDDDGDDD